MLKTGKGIFTPREALRFVAHRPAFSFAVLLLLLAGAGVANAQQARPRNVVFILTDDHRYDAMGFLNHPLARTPNMDALAARSSLGLLHPVQAGITPLVRIPEGGCGICRRSP